MFSRSVGSHPQRHGLHAEDVSEAQAWQRCSTAGDIGCSGGFLSVALSTWLPVDDSIAAFDDGEWTSF